MKNLKLSFALIIAVLAVGFTVATKANFNGSKAVTACYELVLVTDASVPNPSGTPLQNLSCQDAITTTASLPYLQSVSDLTRIRTDCQPQSTIFCCATFDIAPPSSPNYANIPLIDLQDGQGQQKWVVVDVACKPF